MKKKFYSFLLNTIGKTLPISHQFLFGSIGMKFRYFCAKNIVYKIGKNVNIEKGAQLAIDTIIGDNSGIGVNCLISKNVVIGNNVMMGPECLFYTRNHRFDKEKMKYSGYLEPRNIIVEDDVWLGARCIILSGVTIGKGSTIGAGSIVTKDVPPFSVAAGNPARVVKNLLL